jgi:N12 class adenine-specific DNA methylase
MAGPFTQGDRPMASTQLLFDFDALSPITNGDAPDPEATPTPALAHQPASRKHPNPVSVPPATHSSATTFASGDKAKARDILAAIRTLQAIEHERRPATADEQQTLARFAGFGPVALSIFPNPVTGRYKDASWEVLGEELKSLLTPAEYDSARRTTFNAFYTSSTVIQAMYAAMQRLGVPNAAKVLEPGCGPGRFMVLAPPEMRFIGVELDSISGRIARVLHPGQDIRIENFRDTRLPELDAVIGNVPFADLKLEHKGQKFALHDYFFAKSIDALKPGGVLALVTSHYCLDKQNAAIREYLADRADFLGAIRLPSDAFKREGTSVVTDIVFMRKRSLDEPPRHADPDWISGAPLEIEGIEVSINNYFHTHPNMVLGHWSRKDTLYGEGYSVAGNGDLDQQLRQAVDRLPLANIGHSEEQNAASSENPRRPESHPNTISFTPPPPERHLTEGSFFIDDHRAIRQIVDGQGVPVVYGGTALAANGTMTGKRLAALVGLRDCARRVLQSQNEGWPDVHRIEARWDLNRAYDRFVRTYGPINKTTFSATKDGTIRRMPNLAKFREDPDAMLVMSLEDYDEVTGVAAKAAIMEKDVVGKHVPITHVRSAEEGLLVSLDRTGGVDLPLVAELYGKPEKAIITELGDLIYHDPDSKAWHTADEYLSGNVREKLRQADAAGPPYARNADALRAVQPDDILPGDIDANLAAPWIPESDIQAFAIELFGVEADTIQVSHLKKDAVWSVEAAYSAMQSVAALADFGTSRINGTTLFEQALNMKTPVIYDPDPNDPEKRVVNQTETLAAREKQKLIKQRFKDWLFTDPDRSERLVRLYNDTFNSLRPRLFDGSHLDFPGMNQTIALNPHQVNAVWRCMTAGHTLLAHCVGAGKSFEMAAAAMKLKQAGLVKKSLIAVPNHLLEQFAREFQQLYPNAKLLIAAKEDFTRERRKHLTAKIASGDWDAVILTHSSFERIGMSRDYQEQFLNEQIREYEQLILEHAAQKGGNRNIIKSLEKQKAAREEKLKDLLAKDKKDDGLVFDELGVEHIFIDEFQYFKNLEAPTKMERVAGINTGGSERAFDLYMKCRYLDQQHAGHGVTGATGTPVSNSMVELFTMSRFLDPEGLRSRGIDHFDAWAANFGEIVEAMEISPDGKTLKPRSRFAKFINLPELQMMFRSFADVQTPEMLNLPRPKLQTGKPIIVACPMSEDQRASQAELVERYERIRNSKVDPREDNALAITTDGRKLALDGRMLAPTAEDFPGSKVNALVENVLEIWRRTADQRSTQMIFCDMGVNLTQWGYSAYDDVIAKLVQAGIPKQEIASIGDADSDAKKRTLFDKVRSGQVRVLLGSTTKMGTGTNVQKRLVALHHLDAPWKPAEVEQREGRILRQGNDNPEVAIYRYVTQGSFDSYMWQALETKAKFIAQIMTGTSGVRQAEDIGGQELSYAEVKAIASGNPAVLTLAETDAELQRLAILRKNYTDEQFLIRRRLRDLPDDITRLTKRVNGLAADMAKVAAHSEPGVTLGQRTFYGADAVEVLTDRLNRLPMAFESRSVNLGTYRGLTFGITLDPSFGPEIYLQGDATRRTAIKEGSKGLALLNALERLSQGYAEAVESTRKERTVAESQYKDYQTRQGTTFVHDGYSKELTDLRDKLRVALSGVPTEEGQSAADIAEKIKALRAGQAVEAAPERQARIIAAEEPVTARIRRKVLVDAMRPRANAGDDAHVSMRDGNDTPSLTTDHGATALGGPGNDKTPEARRPKTSSFRERIGRASATPLR